MMQPIKDTEKIKPPRQGKSGDSAIESEEEEESVEGPCQKH